MSHMKNIIFLEDNPKRLSTMINEIREYFAEKFTVSTVLYYCEDVERLEKSKIEDVKKTLEVDQLISVDFWNFEEEMQKLYQDDNNVFIFDTQLEQKQWEDFDYMINVNYALNRKDDGRIWFYTVAGPYFKENIVQRFPKYVLDAAIDSDGRMRLKLEDNERFNQLINLN